MPTNFQFITVLYFFLGCPTVRDIFGDANFLLMGNVYCMVDWLSYWRPGLKKIDFNRYSIPIFFLFLSSNTPKSLLFYSSIECAVFFTFLALVSIWSN